ncbi:hypothetical protein RBY4I_2876 [Rhodobacterales bacterium Y4I]|nr:hypothetical protein RBY4I_779 [Rhodobacterales bacterium Y4I]EDZ46377.1 hypothetical protein RBY4I_1591 [Rhodobacterales bacterium Y4I]EDZ47598.1 hypothetical protein RBY4I_2816 [Rhodobacterales bacterium Y4I]EDZ47658.1 hypothetical protein RBY4I_2876 [Rhodobacterales bacterium Y4I]
MQAAVDPAVFVLLSAQGRDGAEPGANASDRRAVSGNAVLRCSADDLASSQRRPSGERETDQTVDAAHGLDADLPEAQHPLPGSTCKACARGGKAAKGHKTYPYLLRGLRVDRPNQVWAADITYLPMRRGFLYLVAIMDWHTRKVLAWRISNTLEAGFCVEALNEAIHRFGPPEIMNTDQGSQFTSFAWTDRLRRSGVRISMDGKGRFLDNIFVERLWRSLKYECVYLHAWETGSEAKAGVGKWVDFYNRKRPHSALGGKPPAVVFWLRKNETQPDQQEQRVA